MTRRLPNQQISAFLKKQPLIKGIDDLELSYLVDVAEECVFGPGEVIFPEGENSNDLYFVYEGEVSVIKIDPNLKKDYTIATLPAGSAFGDLAFLDDEPRSSAVKASMTTTVLKISKETTYSQSSEMTNIYNKITKNIAKITIKRLRDTNQSYIHKIGQEVHSLQNLIKSSQLFVISVLLYWGVGILAAKMDTSFIQDWARTFVVAASLFAFISRFYKDQAHFGLPVKQGKKSLKENAAILLALIGVTVIIFVIDRLIDFIYPERKWINFVSIAWSAAFIIYPLYVFLQEFIARGVIQTNLKNFLSDNKGIKSVLYTSLVLALFYLPLGVFATVIGFALNFFLGYLYNRNPQLLHVTIIHMVAVIILILFGLIPQDWLLKF